MIIDGKAIAARKREDLRAKIASLPLSASKPKLAIILVGNDPASVLYVNLKKKRAEEVGIGTDLLKFQDTVSAAEITEAISRLNADKNVHGVMVQLPLPRGLHDGVCKDSPCKHCQDVTEKILGTIDPEKDVDGLTGKSKYLPATVKAVFTTLDEVSGSSGQVLGKNVTIIGRSREVGKPLIDEMRKRGAIVSVGHTQVEDLGKLTREADILVSATGQPGLVTADMVKPGAIVIDVGSPKGDVDFAEVSKVASAITPVPGGIGPLTVVSLLENVVEAGIMEKQHD